MNCKGEVIPVLSYVPCHEDICSLIKNHIMKMYWEVEGTAPWILNLGTRRWASCFTSWPLYPWEGASTTHWIGGWMGPRAGLDAVAKRKNPYPCQESNPSCPAHNLVTIPTELLWLLLMSWHVSVSTAHDSHTCGVLASVGITRLSSAVTWVNRVQSVWNPYTMSVTQKQEYSTSAKNDWEAKPPTHKN
jgi:hypothetical protein